jgi:hypothetical protein
MLTDRDFYGLALTVGMLAVLGILQSRILKRHEARIGVIGADVEFLKVVARETEARTND